MVAGVRWVFHVAEGEGEGAKDVAGATGVYRTAKLDGEDGFEGGGAAGGRSHRLPEPLNRQDAGGARAGCGKGGAAGA